MQKRGVSLSPHMPYIPLTSLVCVRISTNRPLIRIHDEPEIRCSSSDTFLSSRAPDAENPITSRSQHVSASVKNFLRSCSLFCSHLYKFRSTVSGSEWVTCTLHSSTQQTERTDPREASLSAKRGRGESQRKDRGEPRKFGKGKRAQQTSNPDTQNKSYSSPKTVSRHKNEKPRQRDLFRTFVGNEEKKQKSLCSLSVSLRFYLCPVCYLSRQRQQVSVCVYALTILIRLSQFFDENRQDALLFIMNHLHSFS